VQNEETDKNNQTLRVAGGSAAPKVAGAIAGCLQAGKKVYLVAMGASAVNQAVKAICIARGMVASSGCNLYTIPGFIDEPLDGVMKTAIKFSICKE
jgi:stage V sporulation protein S